MAFISENLAVNERGHLTIGGVDVMTLKEKYGTPLYVMDEDLIRQNLRTYRDALNTHYNGNGLCQFASKAFCTKYMCKIVAEEGLGLDVVSGGELYTALSAGFPAEKICFHGNNKTKEELTFAIGHDVGTIVVDHQYELTQIDAIAESMGKIQNVIFRVKPGIDAHTHDFIMTGQIDSKFGFALETGEALSAVGLVKDKKNLCYKGLHCHIGSQIFDVEPFRETAKVMMNFIKEIKEQFNLETEELDLGGGFGIRYVESDDPIPCDKYIEAVSLEVKEQAQKLSVAVPRILMEPGRSIVAPAGLTVYEVGCVKEIPGIRTYVSVDGGMADNPRYIMYGAEYTAVLANKADQNAEYTYTVAGKCCESGDVLIERAKLPEVAVGDTLCVLATGAYNYSMASNYNRIPRPAVVMVSNGADKLVVKRETYEDLIKNDL
ncbi:MAG: diaminopimelate decarboxylase [Clostridia bacterium]|nr:diaminopimelate decarboxylase [Clostridia bacterium]